MTAAGYFCDVLGWGQSGLPTTFRFQVRPLRIDTANGSLDGPITSSSAALIARALVLKDSNMWPRGCAEILIATLQQHHEKARIFASSSCVLCLTTISCKFATEGRGWRSCNTSQMTIYVVSHNQSTAQKFETLNDLA